MIRDVSAATVRNRQGILMLGLLVAGVNAAAVGFAPSVGKVLFFPLLLLVLAVLVLAVVGLGVRPAQFVVLPQIPAFGTPVPAWKVFLALGFLGPASASLGAVVRSVRQGDASAFDVLVDVPWSLLAVLLVVEAWRAHGVRLHPHGVRQSWVLGSLTVPWEALPATEVPPGADRPSWLRMTVAHPELVRQRGFPYGRDKLRTDNVDAGYLAAAISHYVRHPKRRAAIGSLAEYERLRTELPDGVGGRQPGRPEAAEALRTPVGRLQRTAYRNLRHAIANAVILGATVAAYVLVIGAVPPTLLPWLAALIVGGVLGLGTYVVHEPRPRRYVLIAAAVLAVIGLAGALLVDPAS